MSPPPTTSTSLWRFLLACRCRLSSGRRKQKVAAFSAAYSDTWLGEFLPVRFWCSICFRFLYVDSVRMAKNVLIAMNSVTPPTNVCWPSENVLRLILRQCRRQINIFPSRHPVILQQSHKPPPPPSRTLSHQRRTFATMMNFVLESNKTRSIMLLRMECGLAVELEMMMAWWGKLWKWNLMVYSIVLILIFEDFLKWASSRRRFSSSVTEHSRVQVNGGEEVNSE